MRLVVIPGCRLIGLYFEASWNERAFEVQRAWRRLASYTSSVSEQKHGDCLHVTLWENDGLHGEFVGAIARGDVPEGLTVLDIPAGTFVYQSSAGTATAVRDAFGTMYAWARRRSLRTDEYRIESGCEQRVLGEVRPHDLYVRLTDEHAARGGILSWAA